MVENGVRGNVIKNVEQLATCNHLVLSDLNELLHASQGLLPVGEVLWKG